MSSSSLQDVCAQLRSNGHAAVLDVTPANDTEACELGEALTVNSTVTEVRLELSSLTAAGNYEPLLKSLQSSPRIAKVVLKAFPGEAVSHGVITRFLEALSANCVLHELALYHINIPVGSFAGFCSSTKTLKELKLHRCLFDRTTTLVDDSHEEYVAYDHPDRLAASFLENKTISVVDFSECTDVPSLTIFLGSLQFLPSLKRLLISRLWGRDPRSTNTTSASACRLLQQMLETSASLIYLQLTEMPLNEDTFRAIAAGLRSSRTIQEISFCQCSLFAPGTVDLFETVFSELKSNSLHTLTLVSSFGSAQAVNCSQLAHIFTSSSCCWRRLNFTPQFNQDPAPLIKSLEGDTSHLERLALNFRSLHAGHARQQTLQSLVQSIPVMRGLRELDLCLDQRDLAGNQKKQFMDAFQRNTSLVQCRVRNLREQTVLPRSDEKKLEFCCARNRNLPRLQASPGNLPLCFWPDVLKFVQVREDRMDAVFRCLEALGDLIPGEASDDDDAGEEEEMDTD
jgi:hypothetical protein